MKNIYSLSSRILVIQGSLISFFGIGFLISALLGYFYKSGFLFEFVKDPMIYATMFEAYGLATICGVILITLAKITLSPIRHLIATLICLQFITTSILFWNLYEINNMVFIGYSSIFFHATFIFIHLIIFLLNLYQKKLVINK